jgi:predicted outer membrane repeat protein
MPCLSEFQIMLSFSRIVFHAIVAVSLMTLAVPAEARPGSVRLVPQEHATIQAALSWQSFEFPDGPTEVIVSPGTYNEVINFNGRAINLHSASGNPANTIIDGTGIANSVVKCISAEGPGTIINGFTITGGHEGTSVGGCVPPCMRGLGMLIVGTSSPTVMNCIFANNSNTMSGRTTLGGGLSIIGVETNHSSPTITNCQFNNNTVGAPNEWAGGAAIEIIYANVTLTNCSMNGNSNHGTLTSSDGGAVRVSGSTVTFDTCTFTNNTSVEHGGAIALTILPFVTGSFLPANVVVTNCTFTGNTMNTTQNRGGGAIHAAEAGHQVTLSGSTFSGNSAPLGGAVFLSQMPNLVIDDCIFNSNSAYGTGTSSPGGALNIAGCGGSISNCTFDGNTVASTSRGGGAFIQNSSTSPSPLHVTDCLFTNNQAAIGAGLTIENSDMWGGNPVILTPSANVTDCIFEGNAATIATGNGGGGAMYIQNATSIIQRCVFRNNTSGRFGGAIVVNSAGPTIANCLFEDNSAAVRGGAIELGTASGAQKTNRPNYFPIISNCTIVNNSIGSAGNGAGIHVRHSSINTNTPARISNCIVRGNTGGPNVWFPSLMFPGYLILRHSNIEGAVPGLYNSSGNIDANPLFVDAPNGDYRLQAGSPCIDTGHHWDMTLAGVNTDFDEDPRFVDGNGDGTAWMDMGMFEYQGAAGTLGVFPTPYAYWHFNSFTGFGPVPANIGNGSINLSGWGGTVGVGIGAFFDINRVDDTQFGTSLRLIGEQGNGTFMEITFSMTGRENLVASLVTGTSIGPQGQDPEYTREWRYSTDGVNFTMLPTPPLSGTPVRQAQLDVADFSAVPTLNNAPAVTLRYVVSGLRTFQPSGFQEFIEIDNLQLDADPLPVSPCPADITGDNTVNVNDLLAVINAWGPCQKPPCPADVAPPPNGDGTINVNDLLMVINNWGPCPN